MLFITKREIENMKKRVIDYTTGMTAFDLFEFEHANEDWEIL